MKISAAFVDVAPSDRQNSGKHSHTHSLAKAGPLPHSDAARALSQRDRADVCGSFGLGRTSASREQDNLSAPCPPDGLRVCLGAALHNLDSLALPNDHGCARRWGGSVGGSEAILGFSQTLATRNHRGGLTAGVPLVRLLAMLRNLELRASLWDACASAEYGQRENAGTGIGPVLSV